jgi:translation initiation factor IF-2
VATVLVREGTLRTGDAIVSGIHYGRLRAMKDGRGQPVKEVTPGYPAEVVGLSGVPTAGDVLNVVDDEKSAKEIADHRALKERQVELGKNVKESLETLLQRARTGEAKELRLVLKGDVQGSVEAVAQAVTKLAGPKVGVDIIHKGVGAMTESDVMLAAASKGMVVGFNVKPESGAEAAAKAQGVGIYTYSIIYELIDGVKAAMTGLLEPIRTEKKLGRAEVRNTFNVPRLGTIAGVSVLDGLMRRGAMVRILREGKQVGAGKVTSLKRFKDDVREVEKGFECGVGVEGFADFKNLDIIEDFEIEETRPSLF